MQSCEKRVSALSCRSVSLSVCKELGYHQIDFCEILHCRLQLKSVEKIQVMVKIGQKYQALYMKT